MSASAVITRTPKHKVVYDFGGSSNAHCPASVIVFEVIVEALGTDARLLVLGAIGFHQRWRLGPTPLVGVNDRHAAQRLAVGFDRSSIVGGVFEIVQDGAGPLRDELL